MPTGFLIRLSVAVAALAAGGGAALVLQRASADVARTPVPQELLEQALAAARPGDALFKDGAGLWGRLAAQFSENRDGFGHLGLVARDGNGRLIVIHAGGDPVSGEGRVQETLLADFLAQSRAAALYRPRISAAASGEALAYAAEAVRRNTPFDTAFDLGTEDRLYCTELVWRALSTALGADAVPEKSRRSGRVFIALDDVQESPWLEPVWRFGGAAAAF